MVDAECGVSRNYCPDPLTGYVLEPKGGGLDTGPLCYTKTFYIDADDTLTEAPKWLHAYMGDITCGTVTHLTLSTTVFPIVMSRQVVQGCVGGHFVHMTNLIRMNTEHPPTPTVVVAVQR